MLVFTPTSNELSLSEHEQSFNEIIVLLSTLGVDETTRAESQTYKDNTRTTCHEYLNALCRICDYDVGGKTFTAIGVEAREAGIVYWVATKGQMKDRARKLLEQVLDRLKIFSRSAGCFAGEEEKNLRQSIFSESVSLASGRRIRNYLKLLKDAFQSIRTGVVEDKKKEAKLKNQPLYQALRQIAETKTANEAICKYAYGLRDSAEEADVFIKSQDHASQALWQSVRHWIGRLGSWWRASKALLSMARRSPDYFSNFEICYINASTPSSCSLNMPLEQLIENALRQLYPSGSDQQVGELLARIVTAESKITGQLFKPELHAELAVLRHFAVNNLNFYRDDRYIGGSKSPCYCCYHYMSFHPMKLVMQPSHGNIYRKWSVPTMDTNGIPEASEHATNFFEKMLPYMKAEAHSKLMTGAKKVWKADTATEFSLRTSLTIRTRS